MRLPSLMVILSVLFLCAPHTSQASVVELAGTVESGRFIDGVNLTQNVPSAAVAVEWSSDAGAFASLSCFISEQTDTLALQRGCDLEAGWFAVMNGSQAISLSVSRHDYSSPELDGWEYSAATLRWHLNKKLSLGIRASDSLLGRGIASGTAFAHFSHAITDRLGMNLEAAYVNLSNNDRVDSLSYAMTSIEYGWRRWTVEAKAMWSDSNYENFSQLGRSQPELGIALRYRLY